MIKIDNKELEFQEGMTVAEALKLIGEKLDQAVIIMVDGKVVSKNDLDTTELQDNSKISLLRLISGG